MPEPEDLDLFAPVVPRDRWHPNFARMVDFASEAELDLLRSWARGFRDRDGKFVTEFQTTFNSGFWELYLFALFREAGCALDQQHSRPDFVVIDGPLGEFTAEGTPTLEVLRVGHELDRPAGHGVFEHDRNPRAAYPAVSRESSSGSGGTDRGALR